MRPRSRRDRARSARPAGDPGRVADQVRRLGAARSTGPGSCGRRRPVRARARRPSSSASDSVDGHERVAPCRPAPLEPRRNAAPSAGRFDVRTRLQERLVAVVDEPCRRCRAAPRRRRPAARSGRGRDRRRPPAPPRAAALAQPRIAEPPARRASRGESGPVWTARRRSDARQARGRAIRNASRAPRPAQASAAATQPAGGCLSASSERPATDPRAPRLRIQVPPAAATPAESGRGRSRTRRAPRDRRSGAAGSVGRPIDRHVVAGGDRRGRLAQDPCVGLAVVEHEHHDAERVRPETSRVGTPGRRRSPRPRPTGARSRPRARAARCGPA